MSVTSHFLKITPYQCSTCEVRLVNTDILWTTVVFCFLLSAWSAVPSDTSITGKKKALLEVKSRVFTLHLPPPSVSEVNRKMIFHENKVSKDFRIFHKYSSVTGSRFITPGG